MTTAASPEVPKRVLVVYYSQTGQLARMVRCFIEPLQADAGIEVTVLPVQPVVDFAFPWRFMPFFNAFPETVHLQPGAIVPPEFSQPRYDLIIIAYTVWFLSPSQPITAFLQHPRSRAILQDTPVVTLIGCRNMWLMAQEKMKRLLADAGARLVDNVVKIDACSSAASFVSTPLWMFTGQQKPFAWLPGAGIAPEDIEHCRVFGMQIRHHLHTQASIDQSMLRGMQAVRVNERLILSEKFAQRSFHVWGALLLFLGRVAPWLRQLVLCLYIVFLVLIILTVVPISALVKAALAPWMNRSIQRQKDYFSWPSGE